MSNAVPPDRRELATAALGCLGFIVLGVGMLRWGDAGVSIVAWVSVTFGAAGLIGVLFRLSGRTLGPSHDDLERRRHNRAKQRPVVAPAPVHHKEPLPGLSPRKQGEVRRIVRTMAKHGLFGPDTPDPQLLYAGVAEQGFAVKPDSVIEALCEVDYYHPGTDPERWMANLLMHDSKGEQDEAQQIADIARLADGLLDVREVAVRHGAMAGRLRTTQVDVTMTIDGEAVALSWPGDVKYLSTHIHHMLATRLRAGPSGKRLAWLWTDQGAWISLLDDGAVEAMNSALKLGPRSRCAWSWMDEGEPMAAGQLAIDPDIARDRSLP